MIIQGEFNFSEPIIAEESEELINKVQQPRGYNGGLDITGNLYIDDFGQTHSGAMFYGDLKGCDNKGDINISLDWFDSVINDERVKKGYMELRIDDMAVSLVHYVNGSKNSYIIPDGFLAIE